MPGCSVKRYQDDTVVKSGRRVHLDERDALELAARLRLPVPRVHEFKQTADAEISIRMDFVEGRTLEEMWPDMSMEEKQAICQQLQGILQTMRSIQSGTGTIGSCSGGIVRDCRRISEYTSGPLSDEGSFNNSVCDLNKNTPKTIRSALARRLRTDHRIVFTHGDLTQHNIIVKDNKIVGLVDWEYAGWYPEYWEYVKFFERYSKNKDWKDYATRIFPQTYDDELVDFQAIARWQLP